MQWPTPCAALSSSSGSRSCWLSCISTVITWTCRPPCGAASRNRSTARQARANAPGRPRWASWRAASAKSIDTPTWARPAVEQRLAPPRRRRTSRWCRASADGGAAKTRTISTRSGRTNGSPPSMETRQCPRPASSPRPAPARRATAPRCGATPLGQKSQKVQLHVAAVRDLHQALEWPAPQHACAANASLAAQRRAHGNAHPARNWRPRRRVTSATKRVTSPYVIQDLARVVDELPRSRSEAIVSGGSSLRTFHAMRGRLAHHAALEHPERGPLPEQLAHDARPPAASRQSAQLDTHQQPAAADRHVRSGCPASRRAQPAS